MSHKHFTLLERIKLEGFLDEKIPILVCAKKLNRNPSSVHAEIKRNKLSNGYDRSRTCVSRVKSPVHSRFATYPDVSYRARTCIGGLEIPCPFH